VQPFLFSHNIEEKIMNIGILGSGKVGGALGAGWAKRGHVVTFATRDPKGEKAKALLVATPNAKIAGLQETVDSSDILLLAIPWTSLPAVLKTLRGLEAKIIIDATNRFGPGYSPQIKAEDVDALILAEKPASQSAAEDLAQLVPGAKVVKAFNTIGFDHMDKPQFSDKPTMLVAGDDVGAKQSVMKLAEDLGFEALDAGMLSSATALESLAKAWVGLSRVWGRDFAFKVLKN
jgi:8-hydroxy-5-deazaflavin:NADPH oxidoreductase